MALSDSDLLEMMKGFSAQGYKCAVRPSSHTNPVLLDWTNSSGVLKKFRLWVYEITHGGGGPSVRAANEYRIQITAAPTAQEGLDYDNTTDLLMGYSPDKKVVVAYDRRWLEKRIEKGSGSPSVQVKEEDIFAALSEGMHRITKNAAFGDAGIVTLTPEHLPLYLEQHGDLLQGTVGVGQVLPNVHSESDSLWQYCLREGFVFEPDILARYVASIATKPFVILAGVSGTGKSKIAELVAEYYSRELGVASGLPDDDIENAEIGSGFVFSASVVANPTRFALIPVRPDWIDNQSILGFMNPVTGQYETTQALSIMLRAGNDSDCETGRYFLLLDEMNLARVEHYFSDWLACMESRRLTQEQSISQQAIPLHTHDDVKAHILDNNGDLIEVPVPCNLHIPVNLVVTGTVNVDETTFGFSPKVLDRSMVIEFNEVNLKGLADNINPDQTTSYRFPESLPPFQLATVNDYLDLPAQTRNHLEVINTILSDAQIHFGYRSAAEIGLFIKNYSTILPVDDSDADLVRALDGAILQKVLPRIQGNRARIEQTLLRLIVYLQRLERASEGEDLNSIDESIDANLPQSFKKATEMLSRLQAYGFVTFFK